MDLDREYDTARQRLLQILKIDKDPITGVEYMCEKIRALDTLYSRWNEQKVWSVKRDLLLIYLEDLDIERPMPPNYKVSRVLDSIQRVNTHFARLVPEVEVLIHLAYANYERRREKLFIAKGHLLRAIETAEKYALEMDPRVYLDLGLVCFQLGDIQEAYQHTHKAINEIENKELLKNNPLLTIGELARLKSIAFYNLMTYKISQNKHAVAKEDGETSIKIARSAMVQIKKQLRKPQVDGSDSRRSLDEPFSLQSSEKSKLKKLIEMLDGVVKKSAKTIQKIDSKFRDDQLGDIHPDPADSPPVPTKSAKVQYRVRSPSIPKTLLSGKNSIGNITTMNTQTSQKTFLHSVNNHPVPRRQSNSPSNDHLHTLPRYEQTFNQNTESKNANLFTRTVSSANIRDNVRVKTVISHPSSGVRLSNCRINEFWNRPYHYLDEYAMDDDKHSKKCNNIGKIITMKESLKKIYSPPMKKPVKIIHDNRSNQRMQTEYMRSVNTIQSNQN